jgi:hypothetical protein
VNSQNSRKRGNVSVEPTRNAMNAKCLLVSDVTDPKATLSTLAAFVAEDGQAGAKTA